jgi:hypothetical protein
MRWMRLCYAMHMHKCKLNTWGVTRQPLFPISPAARARRQPLPPECASVRWVDRSIRPIRFPLNYSHPTEARTGRSPPACMCDFFVCLICVQWHHTCLQIKKIITANGNIQIKFWLHHQFPCNKSFKTKSHINIFR